jgi:hypothetical protein
MPNEEIYTFLLDMSNNALIPAVMRLARLVFYSSLRRVGICVIYTNE